MPRGARVKHETIVHNYPHCWRTDEPLIYRALASWYVKVTAFRDRMVELNRTPPVPIILTGAMRPYEVRNTDAVQNMTEALLAVQLLPPGVYVTMHNKVLSFPGVLKDLTRGTFIQADA